jgi:hypothetical protein
LNIVLSVSQPRSQPPTSTNIHQELQDALSTVTASKVSFATNARA